MAAGGNQQIPGYKLIERLGEGGQARIYKAVQLSMNRLVAVKVIPPDRDDEAEYGRFTREARVLAQLRHENIVRAIDHGNARGFRYLVMEYVDGRTVLEIIKETGPLGSRRSLEIALQICRALEHAAKFNVIHRDVKPANIVITPEDRAVLVDFGLARPEQADMQVTLVGTSVGTPHYMPPEQILGEGDLDARVDIYALGASFYHMLSGKVPYPHASKQAILGSHLWEPIQLPDKSEVDIPGRIFDIVSRAMEKEREKRYPTAAEMAKDLQEALDSLGDRPVAIDPVVGKEMDRIAEERDRLAMKVSQLASRVTDLQAEREKLVGERNRLSVRLEELERDASPMVLVDGEFWIDVCPVTNRRYAEFVRATGSPPPRHWKGDQPPAEIAEHPVVWVSWTDAREYAKWCHRRLPSLLEWRRAAQGSAVRVFPWGNEADARRCNCIESGIGGTTPVWKYPAGRSPHGVMDMGGNVAEWVAGSYPSQKGGQLRRVRAVCGGSWKDPLERSRCGSFRGYPEGGKDAHVGFRCARDAQAEPLRFPLG
jgi:serine/threonine-protein kinase